MDTLNQTVNRQNTSKQRLDCSICHFHINPNDESLFATFPCNVRAFMGEKFKVWRCPNCQNIHCLDVVNLDRYYAKYPIAQATFTWPYRITYGKICQKLTKHGFSKTASFLDYGCGANGMFIQYLRQNGFSNCYGYDPYAAKDSFGDPNMLKQGSFDYILLQDVIEHVENPDALLKYLNSLLSPDGYILIGTPNAAKIDLNQPNLSDYYNEVHVPYHLHLYTRQSLENFGRCQGWEPVDFWDRSYSDTQWFSLNSRAWNQYQRLFDGSLDIIFEPSQPGRVFSSYKFWFYAIFGYWLSFKTGMSVMFRKSDRS